MSEHLIPKFDGAELPKDFRPIAVGSLIRRVFSGILNWRVAQVETADSQRGFKAGIEGCTINCRILSDAIKQTTREKCHSHGLT